MSDDQEQEQYYAGEMRMIQMSISTERNVRT